MLGVVAVLEKVRSKGMTEGMTGDALLNPHPPGSFRDGALQTGCAQVMAAGLPAARASLIWSSRFLEAGTWQIFGKRVVLYFFQYILPLCRIISLIFRILSPYGDFTGGR